MDGFCKEGFHVFFFRRRPLRGQKTFTVLSLHVSNIYAQNGVLQKSSSLQSVP